MAWESIAGLLHRISAGVSGGPELASDALHRNISTGWREKKLEG